MPVVYSITTCPWCDKLKKYLKSKGVEYEERNIEENEQYAKECLALSGDTMVPVMTVDGKNYIIGFNKQQTDEMLGL